jgi:hypothetical protein
MRSTDTIHYAPNATYLRASVKDGEQVRLLLLRSRSGWYDLGVENAECLIRTRSSTRAFEEVTLAHPWSSRLVVEGEGRFDAFYATRVPPPPRSAPKRAPARK